MPVAYTAGSPTVTQAVALRQVIPLRALPDPATPGDGTTDHGVPFHPSTSVSPPLSHPTDQVAPFHRSTRIWKS
jgi:hypothetical protein